MTTKILVTGAAGKTGMAVCRALIRAGADVRAWVRRESQVQSLRELGVQEVLVGDFLNPPLAEEAYHNRSGIYHIAPNMSPAEVEIADGLICAARNAGIQRFVYHSVLHPQVEAMPHHWLKMRVEERLFASGLAFTILQPVAYMQNLQGYLPAIVNEGVYQLPYSIDARLSQVDLEDVAQAAAIVLTTGGHEYAIYELCGAEALSACEIAVRLSARLGREVKAVTLDRTTWENTMRTANLPEYAIQTLLKMFVYYEKYDFRGNPRVLEWLIGRPSTRFDQFLDRILPVNR